MVTDEKFHDAIKFFFNRIVDLQLDVRAMRIVLEDQFPGYRGQVKDVYEELAQHPAILECRESIEHFEIEEALRSLASYEGPVQ